MSAVSYSTLSSNFARVKDLSPAQVGKLIGGKVEVNINANIFKNACAIRLSYAFNYSGLPIGRYDGNVSSGKDKKWYLYRVEDMKAFVKKNIGANPIKGHSLKDFQGKKGIIIFTDCGWSDASGHIDLFNGKEVEGQGYFNKCGTVLLYELK
ncbi:type VI secretion system amidase effector protein Tae4 [Bacteroides heparinolyticus]|uniref:type VI secretion system amidase effector protein Tae4 n=1 Tax=Prevotella heparinolytica TaxID=28113 RepID=UPI003AF01934